MKKKYLLLLLINTFSYAQINLGTTILQNTVVASNLNVPWDMTYGNDGNIWFTELSGNIKKMNPNTYAITNVFTIPDVVLFGFSVGLHSIVLHPNFNTNHYLYVHYTYSTSMSKIVRYQYDEANNTLTNPTVILGNIPAGVSHNGSRMVILNDKLFISLGDTYSTPAVAQNISIINGKVLRMNLDGTTPTDNPTPSSLLWSLGHRNPQGLCFGNGKLYSSEHGTGANDEINIIESGRNYGWPNVEGLCNTTSEITFCNTNNVKEPIFSWSPAIAPCGLDYYQNPVIPEWDNSLLLAVLKDKKLIQLKLSSDGNTITQQNTYLINTYGRLRDVLVIPDGRVFICTSNRDYTGTPIATDDRIIELKNNNPLGITATEEIKTSIYPVPANHILHIESNSNIDFVQLIGIDGKKIYFERYSENINVSTFSPGIYILHLLDSNRNSIKKMKIIIE